MAESYGNQDVFTNFHSKYGIADMSLLCSAYENLFDESFLKAFSIDIANCTKAASFKKAYIDLQWHTDEIYSFADIFATGLTVLRSFLLSKEIPKPPYREILSSLLTYLINKGKCTGGGYLHSSRVNKNPWVSRSELHKESAFM